MVSPEQTPEQTPEHTDEEYDPGNEGGEEGGETPAPAPGSKHASFTLPPSSSKGKRCGLVALSILLLSHAEQG